MIQALVHIAFLLVMPPLLLGVINRTKALFAGRTGPPLLQPYYDLARLMRKGMVFSTTTTWIFRAAPAAALGAVLLAGLLAPLGPAGAAVSFPGDFMVLAGLLALARFVTAAAALDTGSPFEGMGAAREVTFACLCEPALLFGFLVLARLSGSLSLTGMLQGHAGGADTVAPLALVAAGLFVALLAETCRIPVDDPNTHLELTMIHEVMVLDHSGPLLGTILYGAAVKLFVLGALVVRVAVPFPGAGPALDWAVFAAAMLALAILIGVVESIMARLQMRHVPQFLATACLLCAFALMLVLT
jgi:formate hydrogenlyase subunit 4